MYSKPRYKICTCSVILGELCRSFRKYEGFSTTFPKNFTYYESEDFSDSSLYHIFESENFRFPFLKKKKPNLGSEM